MNSSQQLVCFVFVCWLAHERVYVHDCANVCTILFVWPFILLGCNLLRCQNILSNVNVRRGHFD